MKKSSQSISLNKLFPFLRKKIPYLLCSIMPNDVELKSQNSFFFSVIFLFPSISFACSRTQVNLISSNSYWNQIKCNFTACLKSQQYHTNEHSVLFYSFFHGTIFTLNILQQLCILARFSGSFFVLLLLFFSEWREFVYRHVWIRWNNHKLKHKFKS